MMGGAMQFGQPSFQQPPVNMYNQPPQQNFMSHQQPQLNYYQGGGFGQPQN